jgi:Ser/Thr protein kinase RdoA (MazF antagonist)
VEVHDTMNNAPAQAFSHLSPDLVISAVESSFGLRLSGIIVPYTSYINRVYGLEDEDGARFVVKFYRPDRWSDEAIREEHRFVLECASSDIPVAAPIADSRGDTVCSVVAAEGEAGRYRFALYPSRGGRQFDAEREEDWLRLGALVGRMHTVARSEPAAHRVVCLPSTSTALYLDELEAAGVVHPDAAVEFFGLARSALAAINPLFDSVRLQRIHGDCHRGNILDRPGEGLMLIDFDDMMTGPAVQDLWLLLPDYAGSSYEELELILEGYGQFGSLDRSELRLIEPLRFMRMIHFLSWSARQRSDERFSESFPDWGGKAFWIKEIEDLRTQERVIADGFQ